MSESQAQRMSFLFCCGSGRADKVCCCTLRTGSYILSVIITLLYIFSLFGGSKNSSSNQTFNIIIIVIKILIQIMFIVSVCKLNFQLSYIVWIIDTIFTYITALGLVILMILLFSAGAAPSVVVIYTIFILLILVFVFYLNYIIYSVSKTIGLNKISELDGVMTSQDLGITSDRMI